MLNILTAITPDTPNLAGDLTGSWNLPALYLDGWRIPMEQNKLMLLYPPL
ncbi:hypothetical protein [Cylindrospermopsis raciborskii]|nr:hypothetical protein [Cylindrospermopsis raciborskii]